jgi:hypothetical protein
MRRAGGLFGGFWKTLLAVTSLGETTALPCTDLASDLSFNTMMATDEFDEQKEKSFLEFFSGCGGLGLL